MESFALMLEDSTITFAGVLLAVLGVLIGIRVTHFNTNLQDLQADITLWYEKIFQEEIKPEFEKEKENFGYFP